MAHEWPVEGILGATRKFRKEKRHDAGIPPCFPVRVSTAFLSSRRKARAVRSIRAYKQRVAEERAYEDRLAELDGTRQVPNDPGFFFGQGHTSAGDDPFQGYLNKPFKNHPNFYAIVMKLAKAFAQAPFQIGRWGNDDAFEPDEQHPIDALFRRPNHLMSGRQLWILRLIYLSTVGEAFFILEGEQPGSNRKSNKEIPGQGWLYAGGSNWTPSEETDADGIPKGWLWRKQVGGKTETIPFARHELVYWRYPDPDDPIRGLPPAHPVRLLLRSDMHHDRYNESLVKNNARPDGMLVNKQLRRVTEAQRQQVQQGWDDKHGGPSKAGKLALLHGGWEYVPMAFNPRDIEYMDGRIYSLKRLASVFGLPIWMLNEIEDVNRSTSETTRASFWEDDLNGHYVEAAGDVETQLLDPIEEDLTARFLIDDVPAMRAARRARWRDATAAVTAGISLKEANRIFDLGIQEEPNGYDVVYKPAGIGRVDGEGNIILPGMNVLDAPPATKPPEDEDEPDVKETEAEPDAEDAEAVEVADESVTAEAMLLPPNERATVLGYQTFDLLRHCRKHGKRATFAQRRAVWRRWIAAVRDPSEDQVSDFMADYFGKLSKAVLKSFNKAAKAEGGAQHAVTPNRRQVDPGFVDNALFDLPEWNGKLVTGLRPVSFEITKLAAAYTSGELGAWTEIDLLDNNILSFLQGRMDLLSDAQAGIPGKIRRQIAEQLQLGIAAGETIQELRARIAVISDAVADPARTLRIARTEAGTLANGLRYAIAEDHVDAGQWVTAADEVVRDTHAADESVSASDPVPIGERYPNTGLLYPQEAGGPPGEVINCRCVQVLVPRTEAP